MSFYVTVKMEDEKLMESHQKPSNNSTGDVKLRLVQAQDVVSSKYNQALPWVLIQAV
jgi:hypothetical protein